MLFLIRSNWKGQWNNAQRLVLLTLTLNLAIQMIYRFWNSVWDSDPREPKDRKWSRWVISRSRHSRGVCNSGATFFADKILFKTLSWQIPIPSYQKDQEPNPATTTSPAKSPQFDFHPLVTLSSKLARIKATQFLNRVPGKGAASGALSLLLFIASDVSQHYDDPQCAEHMGRAIAAYAIF